MAKIAEELILYDKFSGTFTKYLRYGGQAASVTQDITKETQKLAKAQQTASTATSGFLGKLQGLVGAYMGLQGLRAVVDLSDAVSGTTARLNMMNDGLQTTKELQDMIFQSAQRSRGDYLSTAGFVSQLGTLAGDVFSSNAEIIAFAEQINKQIALSGASSQAAAAAIYQLTQGLSSGALRGEELNSVLEQTPMIAQTIADYMGVTTGEMRELASEGKLTANVVKNALLASAEETNAAFENMPRTWGQVWTSFKNTAIQAFNPILSGINLLANNIDTLAPILAGLGAAAIAAAAGLKIQAAATWIANGSAKAFFATLLTNPLTYIVLVIGLIVKAIYEWIQSVGGLKVAWLIFTSSLSYAFNTIKIQFFTVFYAVQDKLEEWALKFQSVSNAIQDFVGDMKVGVLNIIQDMINGSIDLINKFINTVNGFVDIGIEPIKHVTFATTAEIENEAAKAARAQQLEANRQVYAENALIRANKLSEMQRDFENEVARNKREILQTRLESSSQNGIYSGTSDTEAYLSQIASDTDSIKGAVSTTQEDLKMMVDMAERRFVANVNLSAPAPTITIQGQNTGNSREDTRRMLNQIAKVLQEDMNSSTQMNYAFIH